MIYVSSRVEILIKSILCASRKGDIASQDRSCQVKRWKTMLSENEREIIDGDCRNPAIRIKRAPWREHWLDAIAVMRARDSANAIDVVKWRDELSYAYAYVFIIEDYSTRKQ